MFDLFDRWFTPYLTAEVEELKEKGFSFNMNTAAYTQEGKLKNVYLDGEFGGFAIHMMQKQQIIIEETPSDDTGL